MKKVILLIVYSFIAHTIVAQNKSGNTWLFGGPFATKALFIDTTRPNVSGIYNNPYTYFMHGHSNMCDSATGKVLFACNGMVLFDSNCVKMDNGDSLVPAKIYDHDFGSGTYTQSSVILPKGNNGVYYVIIPTVSDTTFDKWLIPNSSKSPYDLLLYHIVDINANGGLGKVIEKNKVLLHDVELHKTMMQACQHSNGVDWWLLKQGRYGVNEIIRFLVTKDSISGPYTQTFAEPTYTPKDLFGQFVFSNNGAKFAAVQAKSDKLFLADFDRCTGEMSNPKVINVPLDSTTQPNALHIGDSILNGVCFSPNDQYIYITRRYNIYQYELNEPDSALAWYRVQHGPDTSYIMFQEYSSLQLGIDKRIYIGNVGGQFKQMSVIDKPDIKGVGCQFCRKCFRLDDTTQMAFGAPPTMPDFNLGASGQVCWPLNSNEIGDGRFEMLEVYPNPSCSVFYIKNKTGKRKYLYNTLGQLVRSTEANEMDVRGVHPGVYYVQCDGETRKVIVE
jgi:hypothetical protein